jgi:ATP-dependent helicase/nuclease subunit B
MSDLFGLATPRVLNVPPSAKFLEVLADGLIQSTGARDNPMALAEVVVFVPNRRSARTLVTALRQQLGSEALIAPLVRTLGDLGAAEEEAAFGDADALDVSAAIDPADRLAGLARLVRAFHQGTGRPVSLTACLSGAEALANLLDQAALEGGVDWSLLKTFVPEGDFAAHWNEAASFLSIATQAWPAHLKERGLIDPMERRELMIRRLAQRWEDAPPDHPVVLAGSTGAQPSVRALMAVVANLPKGCVVLPGLDQDLDESALGALASSPSHPQSALVRSCEALGIKPWQISVWPGLQEEPAQEARRRFVNEALAPAQLTADWLSRLGRLAEGKSESVAAYGRAALSGFELAEAEDETQEALTAALALREALEVPGRTAALVTPDAGLARRVSAALERWGIECPPSEGVPLALLPNGAALSSLLDWASEPSDPAAFLSFLHALPGAFGATRQAFRAQRSALEVHWLRGPTVWRDTAGMAAFLAGKPRQALGLDPERHAVRIARLEAAGAAGQALFSQLWGIFSPLLVPERDNWTGQTLTGLISALEAVTGANALWSGPSGEALATVVSRARAMIDQTGGASPHDVASLVRRETLGAIVNQAGLGHPRLSIWGPLEARLQSRDLFVLAGLDEGIWPRKASIDGLLPPMLRLALGLPDPEERLGLSAHDFAQLASGSEVILLRATRRSGAPTVASRWIWRLATLARGAELTEWQDPKRHRLVQLAQSLDQVERVEPAASPEPRPPVALRPTRYSPSLLSTLQRDPYTVFARNILRLEPLGDAGEVPGARERGTAIHAALERFEIAHADEDGLQALTTLTGLIGDALCQAGANPDIVSVEEDLIEATARHWLDWRKGRRPDIDRTEVERQLDVPLWPGDARFNVTARVDRLDYMKDGTLAVYDYKTGGLPSEDAIKAGLEPQLPLTAALVARNGIAGAVDGPIHPQKVSELGAIAVKSKFAKRVLAPNEIAELAEKAFKLTQETARKYDDPAMPYLARIAAYKDQHAEPYDRLSRFEEWGVNSEAGDDE